MNSDDLIPLELIAEEETDDAERETQRRKSRQQMHLLVLILSTLVVAVAFCLDVVPDERVALRGHPDWKLPPSCMTRELFGLSCPGCGLTRSFVYLARGDWQHSVAEHRMGWLMALTVFVQFPYRLYALRQRHESPRIEHAAGWYGKLLIAALVVNWLWGIAGYVQKW